MAKWYEIKQPDQMIEYPSLIIKLASPTLSIYDYILGWKDHKIEVGALQPKSCVHNHTFSHLLTIHIGRVRAHISNNSKASVKDNLSLTDRRETSYIQTNGKPNGVHSWTFFTTGKKGQDGIIT